MKRVIKIIFKITGILVLLLLTLIALLQTSKGKEMLAAFISKTAGSDAMEVRVGTIRGWVPLNMQVESVEVSDARGNWLVMRNLRGKWVMQDLFRGRMRLTSLGADEVEWSRFPKATGSPKKERGNGDWIRRADVVLEGWSIERLKLGKDLAGMPLEYNVRSGGIVLSAGGLHGDLTISGDAEGHVDLEASFANATNLTIDLHAELMQMNKPTFGMDHISGSLRAALDEHGIRAMVEADVVKDDSPGHLSTRLHFASGQLKVTEMSFVSDDAFADGELDLLFSRDRIDAGIAVTLADTKGRPYTLNGTAQIGTSNKSWSVSVPAMTLQAWNAVTLSVAGRLTPQQIDVKTKLASFELGALPHPAASHLTGRVSGTVSIAGAPASPLVEMSLDIEDFSSASDTLDELPRMDFRVSSSYADNVLTAALSLTNNASGYLLARADMPCRFSLIPFSLSEDHTRINAELDAFLDLDVFNGLAMMESEHVKGLLTAELDMNSGVLSGNIYLENGSYEHYAWGIYFQDVQGRLEATPGGFILHNARATDGDEGRLALTGGLAGGMLDIALDLQRAKIIRRPEAEAMISGRLDISGRYAHPTITGSLVVDRADLLPDNIVYAAPPVLANYDAAAKTTQVEQARSGKPLPIGLDVTLDMPDQVYINASLIDSVWGGSLRLRDTQDGLWIKGQLAPRRGHVNFIGKKFRFVDGAVELDSTVQRVPALNNLTAEYSRNDISARLVLNGSVLDPLFRLESTPALPQDEILAQVLFKRDASTISPYQAIQLAVAARQLSGGLSGPGFMYQFRQAVGVDTLELREEEVEQQGSSVAAGKYLTPELYVEVSSTFGAEAQTDMTAEYEINRHFSVETSAGPKMRPGIGLNWKNDY